MKTIHIALAVALCSAAASAQTTALVRGHKVLLDKYGNVMTQRPAPHLPGAPLVGGSDSCTTPDTIAGSGPFAYDTTLATQGSQGQTESACNFFGTTNIDQDVWFQWTATGSGPTTVSLCGLAFDDTKMSVYSGAGCPSSASLACSDDACLSQSEVTFAAVAGTTYSIQIGAYPGMGGGSGQFTINAAAVAPANDLCSTPAVIAGVGNFPVNMVGATTDGIQPTCLFSTPTSDVWYAWTAPATATATVALCGNTPFGDDTLLAIWPGSSCPTGSTVSIACNDDGCSPESRVSFPATSGTVYLIQVGMFPGNGPVNASMDITMPPPANDECSMPTALAGPGTYPYDASLATTGSQGQTEPLCNFFSTTAIGKDLWYTYVASMNGTATVSTCGLLTSSTQDTKIAVYNGGACPSAPALACKDDDGTSCTQSTLETTLTFPVICGNQYLIQLGQFGIQNVFGSFSLTEAGMGCLTAPTAYCFGDGTGTACPCANGGAPGNGCSNSSTMAGAHLAVSGMNSISADTLGLAGSGMPATSSALYFQGTTQTSGTFGDGLGCAGGTQVRLGTKTNVAGASAYPGAGNPSISIKGGATVGSSLNYQVVYRDASAFCTTATFNTTNGIHVVWAP